MSIKTFQEGNAWCAVFENYKETSEDLKFPLTTPTGYGNTPEDAIEGLLESTLKRAKKVLQEIEPAQKYADDLIARVKEQVLDTQEGIESSIAVVSFRPAYTRSGYDTKALDEYAKEHKEINEFKKPIETKASVALKWVK